MRDSVKKCRPEEGLGRVWREAEGYQSLGVEKVRIHWFSDKELNSLQSNSNICVCVCVCVCVRERERERERESGGSSGGRQ